jgi:hypothetical protein
MKALFEAPAYSLPQPAKERLMGQELNALTDHHRQRCSEYARVLRALFPSYAGATSMVDIPYIPIGLFKSHRLVSVPESEIFRVLASSGTSGQQPSRVYLDRETAELQSRALVHTLSPVLGGQRLPMLIVDAEHILSGDNRFTARAAGILGMMSFGRNHTYVLDDDLRLLLDRLASFLERFGRQPFLLFGFTFIVWQTLYEQAADGQFDMSNGILIHSGGWKKLQDKAISPEEFRSRLQRKLGLKRNYNFYGMVEQVGSVFLEGEDGCLYPSNFSDVVIRNPETFAPAPYGETGLIQVLSVLPRSYPGHSILTEDLGIIVHGDKPEAGRRGKGFRILGRLPRAELRGCSDVATLRREEARA